MNILSLANPPRWLAGVAAAGLLPFGSASLSAQTTATWNGGAGNWSTGSLWSTGTVPNGNAADVSIDGGKTGTASVVTMDNSYTVGRLTVDAGDTLSVSDNVNFTVTNGAFAGSGSVVNNGTINLNGTGSGASLRFNGAGTIGGIGTINLVGANDRVFASNPGDRVTVGQNMTIRGVGNLGMGSTTFTNSGTINASGGTLSVQPGGGAADLTNNGTLSATNGGTVQFSNASGGSLTNNGTLSVGGGSTISVPAGALANLSGTTLTGGDYLVDSTGSTNAATLSLGGGSIVTNNAFVTLSNANSVFTEINALTNNQGFFYVQFGRNFTTAGALTNSGVLQTQGLPYEPANSPFNSNLTISGALNNSGTVIAAVAGAIIVQGNATNTGTIQVGAKGTVTISGTLTNSGSLASSFSGQAGVINVSGALTQMSTGSLAGIGTVTAPTLSLAGTVQANDGAEAYGKLTFNGQVGLLGSTKLVFDLGTTGTSDQLQVNGALTLDGTLSVSAMAGFGTGRYDLINYTGALTDNGLELGALPAGHAYSIDTSRAGEVDLVVTNAVPEPSPWAAMLAGTGFLVLTLRHRARG